MDLKPTIQLNEITNPIIFFDGVCNLCNTSVQFVIRHDKKKQFLFASLQSPIGQQLLKEHQLSSDHYDSFILYEQQKIYLASTGALKCARRLAAPWSWLYGLLIIPRFIRDAIYHFIARNRYRWFGKKEACWLPTPELKSRFLS